MSTSTSPPTRQPTPQVLPPRKSRRVFVWVFLAVQVIFLGWVIYAGVSLPQSGPSNGLAIQMGLWVLTDLILAVIYLIRQLPRTPR